MEFFCRALANNPYLFNCILFYYPSGVKGLAFPPFEAIVEVGYGTCPPAVPTRDYICFFTLGGDYCYYSLDNCLVLFVIVLLLLVAYANNASFLSTFFRFFKGETDVFGLSLMKLLCCVTS